MDTLLDRLFGEDDTARKEAGLRLAQVGTRLVPNAIMERMRHAPLPIQDKVTEVFKAISHSKVETNFTPASTLLVGGYGFMLDALAKEMQGIRRDWETILSEIKDGGFPHLAVFFHEGMVPDDVRVGWSKIKKSINDLVEDWAPMWKDVFVIGSPDVSGKWVFEACVPSRYNEIQGLRQGKPRIHFIEYGDNAEYQTISELFDRRVINPETTG
jgi:hypothetical protein